MDIQVSLERPGGEQWIVTQDQILCFGCSDQRARSVSALSLKATLVICKVEKVLCGGIG